MNICLSPHCLSTWTRSIVSQDSSTESRVNPRLSPLFHKPPEYISQLNSPQTKRKQPSLAWPTSDGASRAPSHKRSKGDDVSKPELILKGGMGSCRRSKSVHDNRKCIFGKVTRNLFVRGEQGFRSDSCRSHLAKIFVFLCDPVSGNFKKQQLFTNLRNCSNALVRIALELINTTYRFVYVCLFI